MNIPREDVYEAYYEARKNKRTTPDQEKFELNLYENLTELCIELESDTYKIGKSKCFIILLPKPREVFAAEFRDRIIHHLVINKLMPLFEEYFIRNSFSCMKGRGTLDGVLRLQEAMLRHPNGYVAKYDLKNFFMSIHKESLFLSLKKFIEENYIGPYKDDLIKLVELIVLNHPEVNCIKRSPDHRWNLISKEKSLFTISEEFGVAIGNLPSQIFAGFDLTPFDKLMYSIFSDDYGRFVDDFYIVHDDPEFIKLTRPKIKEVLLEYGFTLHPDKFYMQKVSHGCKFIGVQVYKDRLCPGNRTLGNFINLVFNFNKYRITNKELFLSHINSYLGHLINYRSYKLRWMIINNLERSFWNFFYVKGAYRSIGLKSKLDKSKLFSIPKSIIGYISSKFGCRLIKSWRNN